MRNYPDTATRLRAILEEESRAILRIPVDNDSYSRAIDMIAALQTTGGKVVTSGMGKAGQIAMNIATTLCSTGTPAVFLHPSEAQHGDLGIIRPGDVLLLLSNSGKTREIVELTVLAEALNPGTAKIVITGDTASRLAAAADVCLPTGGAPEVCPLGLTPTTSTTAMTVIGDMIVVGVMERIGFTVEEYAKRHHGGYLGQVSKDAAERNATTKMI